MLAPPYCREDGNAGQSWACLAPAEVEGHRARGAGKAHELPVLVDELRGLLTGRDAHQTASAQAQRRPSSGSGSGKDGADGPDAPALRPVAGLAVGLRECGERCREQRRPWRALGPAVEEAERRAADAALARAHAGARRELGLARRSDARGGGRGRRPRSGTRACRGARAGAARRAARTRERGVRRRRARASRRAHEGRRRLGGRPRRGRRSRP